MLLRAMKKALYTPRNIGHFGLACERYTHFTSPIRRYPDLVVHRILREALRGEITEGRREALENRLPAIGDLATSREVLAEEAERASVKVKQVQFMESRVGDEFPGLIVGIRPMGMFVQIGDYLIDGLVRVSALGDDYYLFDERMHALVGERTGRTFRLGDPVRVQVVRANRELRQIDLILAERGARRESAAGLRGRREDGTARRKRGPRRSSGTPGRRVATPARRKRA
jgi:ribonuclease R